MELIVWRDVREEIRKIDIQKSIGPLRQGPFGQVPNRTKEIKELKGLGGTGLNIL